MKFKIYKDKNREWRWKLIARNGKIVADGAESYRRKVDIISGCKTIIALMPTATLEIQETNLKALQHK